MYSTPVYKAGIWNGVTVQVKYVSEIWVGVITRRGVEWVITRVINSEPRHDFHVTCIPTWSQGAQNECGYQRAFKYVRQITGVIINTQQVISGVK